MQSPTLPAHYKWGKGSTLAAQGMLGGTDTMVCRVDCFCENGEETQKSASKISFLGHGWDGLCNKITATWSHQPSKPLAPGPRQVIITSEPLTDTRADWTPVPVNHIIAVTPQRQVGPSPGGGGGAGA